MASPLRPDPPEHHRPSHAADFARGDSLDRPVGRLPGPHQRWGTRRANPLAGLAPTGGCGWDVALVASGFLCVYLWVMIRKLRRAGPEVVLDLQGDDACHRLIDACHRETAVSDGLLEGRDRGA